MIKGEDVNIFPFFYNYFVQKERFSTFNILVIISSSLLSKKVLFLTRNLSKMQIRYNFILLLFFILFSSCHKDTKNINEENLTIFTAQVYKEITGTIVGYVYDEKNQPVAEATVAIYSSSTKTNKHGVFVFKNTKMDQQGTFIKVIKNGFILGSDFVYPLEKGTSYSFVKLLALENDKIFDAKTGGNVNVSGGGKVIFPIDAISDLQGNSYNGNVYVTAKHLNPNDRELGNIMPGGLMADASNGNTVVLGTLGMIAVELRDVNGNELQLKSGKKAILEFPAVTAYKPTEIALWSFDENKGRWKEEGKAILVGDKYIGEVAHFSFWNCDAPFPLVEVCGKVLYENGTLAANIGITVTAEGLGTSYGVTNSNGEFCGKMPKGKKLTLSVSHYTCNTNVVEVIVGPFQNNTVLDNIVLNQVPSFAVSGTIKCNNTFLTEGIIVLKVKESTLIFPAKEDGTFSIDLTQYLCGENAPVSIFGYDNVSTETSQVISVTITNVQNLALNVCASTCDFTGNLVFDCNDKISAVISNGSGNFSYTWEDNSTNSFLMVPTLDTIFENKTYCVTVTDINAGCEKIFCKQISGKINAGMEADCGNGNFYAYNSGGTAPFTYTWSNGSTDKELTATAPGNYCYTVTDVNGCTGSACVAWDGPLTIDETPVSCNKNTYNINSSPFISGQYNSSGTISGGDLIYPIVLDIFKTGFTVNIFIQESQCSAYKNIRLPQLAQGLSTTAVNTSCGTCSDGKINISVNGSAQCLNCQAGPVKVFSINDINTDISAANTAGTLSKGEYYVVVTDVNTGCYIAFNKVKIL